MARDKSISLSERMARYLQEIAKERQAKIDKALRGGCRPGFTRDGRVCLVKREER